MGGRSSLQLVRLFGIRVGVNGSWFLVLFLFIFWLQGSFQDILGSQSSAYICAVATALLFFTSIVLHELGHALAAKRAGIEVSGIDLFFFGGIMRMNRETDTPGDEFKVAAAGPLVTLLIILAGTAGGVAASGGMDEFLKVAALDTGVRAGALELLLSFVVTMNAALLLFNLVPAIPLDGGRIARAAVWRITGDRGKATRFAARLGQGFSILLIAGGIGMALAGILATGLWMAVLGWMVGQAARAAVAQEVVTDRLRSVTAEDIMDTEPVWIPADMRAAEAWETFFLRYRDWAWFAVVEADARLVGALHRPAIEHAVEKEGGTMPARELVSRETAGEGRIDVGATLDTIISDEGLRRLGGLMAVDASGRLHGVITRENVMRVLQARLVAQKG